MIAELKSGRPITLGVPIPGSIIFILQEDLTEASEGELIIGGQGLASGYFANPEQTKDAFFEYRGTRVYKTGDFVERTDEGLAYLGRKDSLVKNRGVRINLETQVIPSLKSHPSVLDAIAFKHMDSLIAFVTPASVHGMKIRTWLAERCDSYTIPDQIITIDHFPLTANGKVDSELLRQSLFDGPHRIESNSPAGGGSDCQTVLYHAICDVLNLSIANLDPGRTFWDHGGNSVNVIKLLSYLRERGVSVTFQEILSSTKLSDLHCQMDFPHIASYQLNEDDDSNHTIPATFQQLSMLQSSLSLPLSAHIVVKFDFTSRWDISKEYNLRDAWQAVLSSHPIFSTVVDLENGIQYTSQLIFNWKHMAMSDENTLDETVQQIMESIVADENHVLRSGKYQPSNNFYLIKRPNHAFSLIWPVHHALIDGWSIGIILSDLDAQLCGRAPSHTPTLASYGRSVARYIAEMRPLSHEFWKSMLHNLSIPPALRTICPTSTTQARFRCTDQVQIGISRTDLMFRSRRLKVADSSIIYTSWGIVLALYTSTDQVVFGTVHSGRTLPIPGIERIVAPMINTCPLPMNFVDETPVTEVLTDVFIRHTSIANHQWGVVEALNNIWSTSLNTLFDTVVAVEYYLPVSERPKALDSFGCKISRVDYPEFKLTLFVEADDQDNLLVKAAYDPNALQSNTVESMLSCFKATIQSFMGDNLENRTIGEIRRAAPESINAPLLRQMKLQCENQPWMPINMVTMFRYARELCCDMPAVEVYGRESLTYGELDWKSSTVAHNLLRYVRLGETVAVLSDGSLNWIVAMLGVLKAGATYAPIDVSLPIHRIKNYLKRSKAKLCIYFRESQSAFGLEPAVPLVSFISLSEHPLGSSIQDVTVPIHFDLPAYLVFTSGSTGTPKPVCCTHGGLASYLSNPIARLLARPGRRHAQMYSVGFDVSIAEVLGTICFGATLILKDAADPYAHLSTAHAAMLTPSFLASWAPKSLGIVDTLLLAGEPVTQKLSDDWSGRVQLYNGYGPCEATIISTIKKLIPGQRVTIGSAVPGMVVHIVDEHLRLVPIGVAGQICISGIQVAAGYLDTDSISVAFRDDPFLPNRRMYCTGDIGMWTEDLEILFLGRRDNQVKVRGFRVEIEEIEDALLSSPHGIKQAGVFLDSDAQTLAAVVTPRTVDVREIRSHLQDLLPPHTIPSRIITRDILPLTSNQKLDRTRLIDLCTTDPPDVSREPDFESRSVVEISIYHIWTAILGLASNTLIRSTDRFHDLGGHSLRQLRLSQSLSQKFNVTVPLPIVLKNPTLSELAIAVDRLLYGNQPTENFAQPAWSTTPDDGSLSSLEEQFCIYHTKSALRSAFNLGVRVYFKGNVNMGFLERAINHVLGRHEILRSRYQFDQKRNTYYRSLHPISPQVKVSSSLMANNCKHVSSIVRPLDLFDDLLIDAELVNYTHETTLELIMHHIITDEDSINMIVSGIGEAYESLRNHGYVDTKLSSLTPPLQYTQWATWSRANPTASADSTKKFWKEKFSKIPALPFSSHGAIHGEPGNFTTLEVQTGAESRLSQAHVIAAVGFSIAAVTNMKEVVIGISHLDRSTPGTQSLVGLFLDRLPVSISVGARANVTPTVLIQATEQQLNSCLDNIVPYRCIQEVLSAEKRELFDIMLSFHRADANFVSTFGDDKNMVTMEYTVFRDEKTALFPLLVDVFEVNGGLRFDMLFKPRLVSHTCIAAINNRIKKFLEQIAVF